MAAGKRRRRGRRVLSRAWKKVGKALEVLAKVENNKKACVNPPPTL